MDRDREVDMLQHLPPASEESQARAAQVFGYAQVGQCVGGIVHDINNYLGAVMAYAELVEFDEALSEESRRMLREIGNGVSKSSELLNTLTVTSRIDSTAASMLDLSDLTRRVLNLRLYALKTKQIEVEIVPVEALPSVVANVSQIQMALLLLLMNAQEAVEAAGDGAEERKIRISIFATENAVALEIWNSAGAIPETLRAEMFQPHFTSRDGHHLGLGLAQARRIAEQHNSTLTYAPDTGFVFSLSRDTGLTL
ncbi:MAG: HAMP domain-containing histidine kinase [Gammaproteobacteria bacterium]|nr:HAMP domain-containing histidine kinase [Gammaproteobacteria bacterium]